MKCRAKQFSDTMVCDLCGLTWDTNDPVPPVCGLKPAPSETRKQRGVVLRMVLLTIFLVGMAVLTTLGAKR